MTIQTLFGKTKLIHFLGIGGIGMSGIARVVSSLGCQVSGSDLSRSEITDELEELGMIIKIGKHSKKNLLPNVDVLVNSSAISPANPEILEAKKRGIPIISRAEMLSEIMRLKKGIAIAGTHGKTTTTSMTAAIFNQAKLEPTTIIGGKWFAINCNAQVGKSDYLISEADESDGSFLKLSPVYSAVTNIDWDHMDFYKNKERLLLYFLDFINKTPFYGMSSLCFDDENILNLVGEIEKPFIGYAIDDDQKKKGGLKKTSLIASNIDYKPTYTEYDLSTKEKKLDRLRLNIPGRHNVLNSLAAVRLSLEVGIPLNVISAALLTFQGVERRMSRLGHWRGFELIDDYGHHPREIYATLSTIKKHCDELVVVFQPHRFSRTLEHYADFAKSLTIAHRLYLAPIYSAGETPIENANSNLIAEEVKKLSPTQPVILGSSLDEIYSIILEKEKGATKKNACLITIGAGNIFEVGKKLKQSEHVLA